MKSRVAVITWAAIAAVASAALAAPPAPPPEYTMVELFGEHASTIIGCSETRAGLRAAGYLFSVSWIQEDGTPCNGGTAPAYWDVVGAASPVAPVMLPSPSGAKPALVAAVSQDGTRIAGSAWDGDAPGCGWHSRPVLWEQGPGGWSVMDMPVPPGYSGGRAWGVTAGATTVVGSVHWPELLPDGTSRRIARGIIWRRSPEDGSFSSEILTDTCWGCDSIFSPGGLRYSGTVAAAGVEDDVDDGVFSVTPRYWEDVGGTWVSHDLPLLGDAFSGKAATHDSSTMFYGDSRISAASNLSHAVVWETATSPARDLGALDGETSRAMGQNGAGVTVGAASKVVRRAREDHAVRWTPPTWPLVDLNTKANTNGFLLTYASDVDASGRIVGQATKTTRGVFAQRSFALIPTN